MKAVSSAEVVSERVLNSQVGNSDNLASQIVNEAGLAFEVARGDNLTLQALSDYGIASRVVSGYGLASRVGNDDRFTSPRRMRVQADLPNCLR